MTDIHAPDMMALTEAIKQLRALKAGCRDTSRLLAVLTKEDEAEHAALVDVLKSLSQDLIALRRSWPAAQQAVVHAKACVSAAPTINQPVRSATGNIQNKSAADVVAAVAELRAQRALEHGAGGMPLLGDALPALWHDSLAEQAVLSLGHKRHSNSQHGSGGGMDMDTLQMFKRARAESMDSPAGPVSSSEVSELRDMVVRLQGLGLGTRIFASSINGNMLDTHQLADAIELRVLCPSVFCASVLLARPGAPQLLRVAVHSADKAASCDPWSNSPHQVFRRLSALAMRVYSFYALRAKVALHLQLGLTNHSAASAALEDTLLWLSTYQDLFSKPCSASGKLLALDPSGQHPLPPLFREYKLSRAYLVALATDASLVRCWHMHSAPSHMLGWTDN